MIKLPAEMCVESHDKVARLDAIFGTDENNFNDPTFIVARGILTSKNADVDELNDMAL